MKIVTPIEITEGNEAFTRASTGTYFDSSGVLQTAAIDEPRFDHNPVTGEPLGLLIEDERTNRLLRSEEFDNAVWTKERASISANSVIAPDGMMTADKLVEYTTASSNHQAFQFITPASGAITFSCYVKAAGRTQVSFSSFEGSVPSNPLSAIVDLSTGLEVSRSGLTTAVSIIPVGNEWYRIAISGVSAGTITSLFVRLAVSGGIIYTGDGTSGIYIWGAQLEAGTTPSSYIKTEATTVTRAADDPGQMTTNVVNDYADWTAGTYNTGTRRVEANVVYEVVASPNTIDQPSVGVIADPPSWIRIGWSNQFRMFRDGQDSYSDRLDNIDVTLIFPSIITTVAVLGVQGAEVQVTMTDPVDGVVYDETISLVDIGVLSHWEWHFLPYDLNDTAVFEGLPPYSGVEINIVVRGVASTDEIRVGRFIAGISRELGVTNYGTSIGALEYSTKERDGFGNLVIVPRRTVRLVNYDVLVNSENVDRVVRTLESLSAKPTLYIGDDTYSSTVVFGLYRDYTQGLDDPKGSDLTIQVEGF
jgi:hypothetical protein